MRGCGRTRANDPARAQNARKNAIGASAVAVPTRMPLPPVKDAAGLVIRTDRGPRCPAEGRV